MRRLIRPIVFASLIASVLLLLTACKRERPRGVAATSGDGMLATMLQVADPRVAVQLTKGFYPIENNSWRWTASHFSVTLRPPRNAAQNGARLVLKFAVPEPVLQKVHAIKISAKVNGLDLPPQEYVAAGDQSYAQDVPPSTLKAEAVNVDFALDKFLPPSPSDQRELGIIVSAVGFEAK